MKKMTKAVITLGLAATMMAGTAAIAASAESFHFNRKQMCYDFHWNNLVSDVPEIEEAIDAVRDIGLRIGDKDENIQNHDAAVDRVDDLLEKYDTEIADVVDSVYDADASVRRTFKRIAMDIRDLFN